MVRPFPLVIVLVLVAGCGRLGFDLLGKRPRDLQDGGSAGRGDAGPFDDAGVPAEGTPDGAVSGAFALRLVTLPYVPSDAVWARVASSAPAVGLTVLNPSSGVGTSRDDAFVARVSGVRARGVRVLGYVVTDYATRPIESVYAELDQYRAWYEIDGFFLDQASADCDDLPYYRSLFDRIKADDGTLTVALDPGALVPECYASAADVLFTFQGSLAQYENHRDSGWERAEARNRFGHLVYGATTLDDLARALELAHTRHVGWVYVTDDALPNPWDTLPPEPYWAAVLSGLAP